MSSDSESSSSESSVTSSSNSEAEKKLKKSSSSSSSSSGSSSSSSGSESESESSSDSERDNANNSSPSPNPIKVETPVVSTPTPQVTNTVVSPRKESIPKTATEVPKTAPVVTKKESSSESSSSSSSEDEKVAERSVNNNAANNQVKKESDNSSSDSSSDSESSSGSEAGKNGKENDWEKLVRRATTGSQGLETTKYLRRIEQSPKQAKNWVFFALYLIKKDNKRAERYFKRAILVDPNYATGYSCYGLFLETIKKEHDHAEAMYKKACDLSTAAKSNDASPFCNYAVFLQKIRKDTAKSEEFYLKALAANPAHINSRGNYGLLLLNKKDMYQAEKHLGMAARSVKDSRQVQWVKIYAQFLFKHLQDKDGAKKWTDTAKRVSRIN